MHRALRQLLKKIPGGNAGRMRRWPASVVAACQVRRDAFRSIDETFYGATYLKRDVSKWVAYRHFQKHGQKKGFWPNCQFDPVFYFFLSLDVLKPGQDALRHYVNKGRSEGRLSFGMRRPQLIAAKEVVDLRGDTIIRQRFTASSNYLSCIVVPVGNYNNSNSVAVAVSVVMLSDVDRVVLDTQLDGRLPSQHEPLTLYFDPVPDSVRCEFEVVIKSGNALDQSAAWPVYLGDRQNPALINDRKNPSGHGLLIEDHYSPPTSNLTTPSKVLYSPVTQCNLNCVHCISAHTRKKPRWIGGDVKSSLRKWAAEGRIALLLSDYSGDLLWADHRSPGELDFVIGLDVPFSITTNGVHLDAERSVKLLQSPWLQGLNVSLDAATTATFKRIRKGAPDLEVVLENIRCFERLRDWISPRWAGLLTLSFALMRSNLHELVPFVSLADSLGIRGIVTDHVQCYTAEMIAESLWFDKERFNRVREEALTLAIQKGITLHIAEPFSVRPAHNGRRHCPEPWWSAVVLGNGDVQACCVPGTKMGNLNEQSMELLWAGESYRQFRLAVNSPTPPKPCQSCPLLRTENNPSTYLICELTARIGSA